MARLLVVDDEPSICWGLAKLGQRLGHVTSTASSAEQGLEYASERAFDLIVLDVRLPSMDGLTAMKHFRVHLPDAPIVVITAYGDLETAVEAVRNGAFEYIVKPFDLDQVERVIQRALLSPAVTDQPTAPQQHVAGLVGSTLPMQEVFRRIALVAASDACVLLQGESGTGKDLVARAIHRYSRRSDGPFVAVNVASLSSSLAESELFGHMRGAFTGAEHDRSGLLVQANGGTLFLDEVADIPLPTQVKLLRSLEHHEVTPVGSSKPVATDFRVISATHQNLQTQVRGGTFRHDLFYRLNTFHIDLPPLRERRDDIAGLAEHFVSLFSAAQRTPARQLTPGLLKELRQRPWYGNVRELRNSIEHALILAREGTVAPEHLPPPAIPSTAATAVDGVEQIATLLRAWAQAKLSDADGASELYEQLLELVEPPLLEAAIKKHRGQCASAARSLGMHRTTLRKKLDRYGIDVSD